MNKSCLMNDLISVLIPAYNHEKYIIDCIQSIIDQTYQNIELIIIDDGSNDKTSSLIKEIATKCYKRFNHFEFLQQKNAGVAMTCKRLLSLARGKYVNIIASDDCFKPEAMTLLHGFLDKNPDYALAVGDNEMIDENSNRIFWNTRQEAGTGNDFPFQTNGQFLQYNRPDVDFSTDQMGDYSHLIQGNYIPNGYLIRKSIIDQTDAYREDAPLEDWYMLLQLSKQGRFKYFDRILFSYRWHSKNTAKNRDKMKKMTQETFELEERNIFEKNIQPFKSNIMNYYIEKKQKKYFQFWPFKLNTITTPFYNQFVFYIFNLKIIKTRWK